MRTRDLKRKLRKEMFTGPRTMTYNKRERSYCVEMCGLVDKKFKTRKEAEEYIKSLDWHVVTGCSPERWDDKTVYYLLPNGYNVMSWAAACVDRISPYVSNPEFFKKVALGR